MDSFYMGDDMGDDMGDLMGELVGDEVGASRRRIRRLAKRHGMVVSTKAQLQEMVASAAEKRANMTNVPQSLQGGRLATSSQRLEVLPLGSATLAAAIVGVATLSVNVQRPIQPYRLILQAADATTGVDSLFSVGVNNVVLGAHNLFASPGITAPATGFGRDAWGTEILSVPMLQGGVVRVDLLKLTATANALVVSGLLLGYAAG